MAVLIVTDAGASAENQAIANGTPLSPVEALVISDGTPPADPDDYRTLTAVGHEVYRTAVLLVEHVSDTVVKFTGTTPVNQAFRIREVGLVLADGTLFGYAPYMLADDGFFKGSGLAWTFSVYLSREQGNTSITVNYNPIDVSEITEQIVDNATTQMDLYLQADFIEYVKMMSGLAASIYRLQQQINAMA